MPMHRPMLDRAANVFLRVATLISRFILLFGLAKYMPVSEFVNYGLIVAFVGFGVLFIGGEFYQFSSRELAKAPPEHRAFIITNQILGAAVLYLLLVPLFAVAIIFDLIPKNLSVLVFMVLIVDHISQEIYRSLVVLNHQVKASFQMFIRSAVWVWLIFLIITFYDYDPVLYDVLVLWCSFSAVSVVLGVIWLKDDIELSWPPQWDFTWVLRGFRVGALFFVSALALRSLTILDRYAMSFLTDAETTAAYILFFGMAMVIVNILDPAVLSFSFPNLIRLWSLKSYAKFRMTIREMWLSAFIILFVGSLIVLIVTPYLLVYVGKDEFVAKVGVLKLLLLMAIAHGLSLVPHFGLYSMGLDRALVACHYGALIVFLISVLIAANYELANAVPIALTMTFLALLLVKTALFNFYFKRSSVAT